jgi:hypothetical protein
MRRDDHSGHRSSRERCGGRGQGGLGKGGVAFGGWKREHGGGNAAGGPLAAGNLHHELKIVGLLPLRKRLGPIDWLID